MKESSEHVHCRFSCLILCRRSILVLRRALVIPSLEATSPPFEPAGHFGCLLEGPD